MMSIHDSENVIQTLARHLGVPPGELALTHDLYRDWGFTPLSLVVVLLDLERSVALELPPEGLSRVRTVADLVHEFRAWVQHSDDSSRARVARHSRLSRRALSERRLRRELHHLRWLEREWSTSNVRSIGVNSTRPARQDGVARRVVNR